MYTPPTRNSASSLLAFSCNRIIGRLKSLRYPKCLLRFIVAYHNLRRVAVDSVRPCIVADRFRLGPCTKRRSNRRNHHHQFLCHFVVPFKSFSLRRDGVIAPYRSASLHDLPMAGFGYYAHFLLPFDILATAFPFSVSRYFCVGERGELGCVISTNPISRAGYKALLRRCARLENRIFARIW